MVKIADTWDELADWMGVDRATFKATMDEYNAACDQSHDSVFNKDRRYLKPLRTPPYIAILGQAHICDTIGGIKIDEKCGSSIPETNQSRVCMRPG